MENFKKPSLWVFIILAIFALLIAHPMSSHSHMEDNVSAGGTSRQCVSPDDQNVIQEKITPNYSLVIAVPSGSLHPGVMFFHTDMQRKGQKPSEKGDPSTKSMIYVWQAKNIDVYVNILLPTKGFWCRIATNDNINSVIQEIKTKQVKDKDGNLLPFSFSDATLKNEEITFS